MFCWWPAAKKSNSSIPSIIDFIIIPLSFHEIPSIIEVLSLFDSFNYCYNIIYFHSILFTSIKEMEFNKLKDFIFLFGEMEWLDWRKRRAAPSLIDFINGCGWLVMSFHASSSINQPLPFHFNQSIKETQLISLIKDKWKDN